MHTCITTYMQLSRSQPLYERTFSRHHSLTANICTVTARKHYVELVVRALLLTSRLGTIPYHSS